MKTKYLVYAGCDNEGQVLQGQPYNGPIDSASVADFARETLLGSIYSRSDTVYGLEELDWREIEDCSGEEDAPVYMVQDDRDDDGEDRPEYWVAVELA